MAEKRLGAPLLTVKLASFAGGATTEEFGIIGHESVTGSHGRWEMFDRTLGGELLCPRSVRETAIWSIWQ